MKTRSISAPYNEVNNKLRNDDVRQLIREQLTSELTTGSTNKLITQLMSRTKFKTNHRDHSGAFESGNRVDHHRRSNARRSSSRNLVFCHFIKTSLIVIFSISNLISNNPIYAKSTASDDRASPSAPFFTNNLPSKVAFYNTTGSVLNCPVSGNAKPKPTIHWFTANSYSNLNSLNSQKTNYRYSTNSLNSFFNNQHWPIGGHYQASLPLQSSNLIENIVASSPDLSPVVDLHNVIYTRNDGALIFPPFYANDLQPSVHNRKYRCLAINEHGALLSNEIQVKARKFFFALHFLVFPYTCSKNSVLKFYLVSNIFVSHLAV